MGRNDDEEGRTIKKEKLKRGILEKLSKKKQKKEEKRK